MKVIVRAQLVTDWGEISEITVAEIERPAAAFDGSSLGLSLSDGKQVMQACSRQLRRPKPTRSAGCIESANAAADGIRSKTIDSERWRPFSARCISRVQGLFRVPASHLGF